MLIWILAIAGGVLVLGASVLIAFRLRFKSHAVRLWLKADAPRSAAARVFRPELVAQVPEPARRYLLHAIAEGTPLATRAELMGEGEIRLKGEFKPFVSRELVVARRGFVWKADLVAPVSAVDHYLDDEGEMRALVLGCLPLMRADGPDVTRSSRHRFAVELIWLPTALLPSAGVTWERIDEGHARVKLLVDAEPIDLTLAISGTGRLEQVQMQRWSDQALPGQASGEQAFRFVPYQARVEAEGTFAGLTIPTGLSVGVLADPRADLDPGFRVTITDAEFR